MSVDAALDRIASTHAAVARIDARLRRLVPEVAALRRERETILADVRSLGAGALAEIDAEIRTLEREIIALERDRASLVRSVAPFP